MFKRFRTFVPIDVFPKLDFHHNSPSDCKPSDKNHGCMLKDPFKKCFQTTNIHSNPFTYNDEINETLALI